MQGPIRVGIADDDSFIRTALTRLINTEADLRVVRAVEDGAPAVALAQSGAIDILILDLEMPTMNGVEALQHIRQLAPAVNVIVHSSRPAEDIAAAIRDAGAAAYLQKPCCFELMLQAIRDAFRPPRVC